MLSRRVDTALDANDKLPDRVVQVSGFVVVCIMQICGEREKKNNK